MTLSFASQALEVPLDGLYSADTVDLPVEEMIELGRRVVERVRDHRPEVLVDVTARKQMQALAVFTSRELACSYRRSALRVTAHVSCVRDTEVLDVHHMVASVFPDLGLGSLVARVRQKMGWTDRTAQPPGSHVPVILTLKGASMLLPGLLERALSGKSILEGSSPLSDKLESWR